MFQLINRLFDESEAGRGLKPFVSGHFEYGIGRPAKKREVLLFVTNKQDA